MDKPKTSDNEPTTGDIVVGFDGSPSASAALEWAAIDANQRSAYLRIITVAEPPRMAADTALAYLPDDLEAFAARTADDARVVAAKFLDESRIRTETRIGNPAGAIVAASDSAQLVVVGSRGRDAFTSAILGSVSLAVTAHAHCPVAVVQGTPNVVPGPTKGVVVGVDGSDASDQALEYAADMAMLYRAPLTVVSTWEMPPSMTWHYAYWETASRTDWAHALKEGAEAAATKAVAAARHAYPRLTVIPEVLEASPARALEQASADAGLVVVGARGLGGFERLLLGSVSRSVVRRSDCPVVVVRS